MFNRPFPSRRPPWLINPNSKSTMELDGYNTDLKLAFEFQGEHHYPPRSRNAHLRRRYRKVYIKDNLKQKICETYGVVLITVPYFIKNHIHTFIKRQVRKHRSILHAMIPTPGPEE